MDPDALANTIKDQGVYMMNAPTHEIPPFRWYAVKSGRVPGLYKRPDEAQVMVTRFRCNQSAKFDNFDEAAEFVCGKEWREEDTVVFVHWGPAGPPPPLVPEMDEGEGVVILDDEGDEVDELVEDDDQGEGGVLGDVGGDDEVEDVADAIGDLTVVES